MDFKLIETELLRHYEGKRIVMSFDYREYIQSEYSPGSKPPYSGSALFYKTCTKSGFLRAFWPGTVTIQEDGVGCINYGEHQYLGMSASLTIDGKSVAALVSLGTELMLRRSQQPDRLRSFVNDLAGYNGSKVQLVAKDGTEILADTYILCARSQAFAKMLTTDMKEKSEKKIAMPFSPGAIELLLGIVYVKRIDCALLSTHLAEVLQLVDMYRPGKLADLTGIDVKDIVTKGNAVEVFDLCLNHKQPEMLQRAFVLIRDNRAELATGDKWNEVVNKRAELQDDLFVTLFNTA